MTNQTHFPKALLAEPPAQRLHYFERKLIAHPRLTAVYEAVLQAIRHPAGASLIFVYGPTGVGKTTLRHGLEQHLISAAALSNSYYLRHREEIVSTNRSKT